jgi:hypothetical protein
LLDSLASNGVRLSFAEMKRPVKDQLKRYGLFAEIGSDYFFPTIESAVRRYVAETGVSGDGREHARGAVSTRR